MSTYNENMDTILRTFKSQWDATGIPVVYELIEADLKPHPRDTGNAWVRVVVRHNDAVQKSLPGPKGKTKYWRYGLVWIQLFVPAVSGASWTAAQDLAEVAQKAYEGKFDPNITYLKAAIEDKSRDNGWVRKDIKVFFHWDETEVVAGAPPTPGNINLIVPVDLGVAMTAALTREQDLAATNALGLAMTSILRRESDLSVTDALGLTMASVVRRERDLSVTDALGLTMASPVRLQKNLSAALALGLTMGSTVRLQKNLSVPITLGLTMASPVKLQKNLSVPITLGLTMASPVKLQKNLSAALALGLTMGASVSAVTQMVSTFLGAESLSSAVAATQTFTNVPGTGGGGWPLGTGNANLWAVVAVFYGTAGIRVPSAVTIGAVSMTRAVRASVVTGRNCDIWYANVTAGGNQNVVVSYGGNTNNGSVAVYKLQGPLSTANITTATGGNAATFTGSLAVSKSNAFAIAAIGAPVSTALTYTEPASADYTINDSVTTTYQLSGGHHDGRPTATWAFNMASAGGSLTNYAVALFPPT